MTIELFVAFAIVGLIASGITAIVLIIAAVCIARRAMYGG